jgi:hypothetical protein
MASPLESPGGDEYQAGCEPQAYERQSDKRLLKRITGLASIVAGS